MPYAPFVPEHANLLAQRLIALQTRLRDTLLAGRSDADADVARLGDGANDYSGDTIYRIDERGEAVLLEWAADWARSLGRPLVLIAEGIAGDGRIVLPAGGDPNEAAFECIVDPIDGTRGLMYDKRSAWALTAIAPGRAALGRRPRLSDVLVAAQAELPTSRARLADTLWATAEGVHGTTTDLVTGVVKALKPYGAFIEINGMSGNY